MQELIEYTLKDLETIVAAAPYSQYHQMMLALKRNEMQRSTLYQPVLGTLPALERQLHQALDEIESIPRPSIVIQQQLKLMDQSVEKDRFQIEKDLREPSKAIVSPPLKIEKKETEEKLKKEVDPDKESQKSSLSKKIKSKKKKKKKSRKSTKSIKKDKFTPELNDLSPFTQWLISGENDPSDPGILSKKKKSKKKDKKSKKKKKKSKSVVDNADKAQKENIEVISEPLAFLLAKQGHTKKAIKAFSKLITLFPEKQSIYEEEIKKLKGS